MSDPDLLNSLETPAALMLSIAAIAERDGVSRPAVSQKVKRLVDEHGLAVTRDGRGRVSAVNVAQYDLLRDRFGDPSKDQRPTAAAEAPSAPDPDSYDDALRRKTLYEAERKRLELEEQIGRLVRADEIETAAMECGESIAAIVRTLQNEADALAAAVARDGVHGMRVALKQVENRLLGEIADAFAALAQHGVAGNREVSRE